MQTTPVSQQMQVAAPTQDEKTMGLIVHFGAIMLPILLPLIIYLVKKDESKYVAFHSLQALYFTGAWWLVYTVVGSITLGIGFLLFWPVPIVFNIIAGIKVSGGQNYEYPIVGKMARTSVYGS